MLDHKGVPVWDFERSKRFSTPKPSVRLATSLYHAAQRLGGRIRAGGQAGVLDRPRRGRPSLPHIAFAFAAAERATVDAFHEAAIAAGGRDNGGPGLRPEYHPSYYGPSSLIRTPTTSKRSAMTQDKKPEPSSSYSPNSIEVEAFSEVRHEIVPKLVQLGDVAFSTMPVCCPHAQRGGGVLLSFSRPTQQREKLRV